MGDFCQSQYPRVSLSFVSIFHVGVFYWLVTCRAVRENLEVFGLQLCALVMNMNSSVADKTAVSENNLSAVDGSGVFEPIIDVGFSFLVTLSACTVKSE